MKQTHISLILFSLLQFFILITSVLGASDKVSSVENAECSITNIGVCFSEQISDFFTGKAVISISSMLLFIKKLFLYPVDIAPFKQLWQIIVHVLSLFYSILLLGTGLGFILSGPSPVYRSAVKNMLKQIILMVFFVQSSFYIYSGLISLNTALSVLVSNNALEKFHVLSTTNVFLDAAFFILLPYFVILVLTTLLLVLQHILVSIGLVLFPIGIFLKFIPPLKSYGQLIINVLVLIIFIPFFQVLVLAGASKLADSGFFAGHILFLHMAAFLAINLLLMFFFFFASLKAGLSFLNMDFNKIKEEVMLSHMFASNPTKK